MNTFFDHIRNAVEKESLKLEFGHFTGAEIRDFIEVYERLKNQDVKNYYQKAARILFNSGCNGYNHRFESFEIFKGMMTVARDIMRNAIDDEIDKRDWYEKSKRREKMRNYYQTQYAL